MNRQFFIAWAVLFVVWMGGSFVVHGVLLQADYKALPNLFRSESDSQKYFPLMILAHVMMAGALSWIYSRGIESGPWLTQGLRFGAAVALLMCIPWYTIYYVVQPMPEATVVKQILFDGLLVLLLGVVAAFCYRKPPQIAR